MSELSHHALSIADASPLNFAIAARDRDTLRMVEDAVRSRNVMLAYQPIYSASGSGRPVLHEALLRVRDASGRVIPAREFIAVAEENELGRRLDCLSLQLGLEALAADAGLRLSVNMSARSIGYRPWMQVLDTALAECPALAERLVLEITEASAMLMPDIVRAFMADLTRKGIGFALDDFGAGYTSFRYLRDFSFDILKIDGQFTRNIHEDPDNQVLLEALVSIGQHFGMLTIAESVETAREAAFLSQSGVDYVQGYYFAAPMLRPQR